MPKNIKRFVVKPRSPRVMEQGLQTMQGVINFKGKTQKIITDESLAREIDSEYGLTKKRDVYVYEDDRLEWHDSSDKQTDGIQRDAGGHRYFFGGMFSDEAWERYQKKKKRRLAAQKRAEVKNGRKKTSRLQAGAG